MWQDDDAGHGCKADEGLGHAESFPSGERCQSAAKNVFQHSRSNARFPVIQQTQTYVVPVTLALLAV